MTLTATVTSSGSPVSTGTVQFSDDGTALGAPVAAAADGTATLTTSALAVGSHPLTATYSGSTGLATSSDTLTQVVDQATTTTALTSSVNPSTAGQSVTLTATVTSSGSPVSTGTVQFSDDGTALGAPVAAAADGTATLTTSALAVGSHPLTATYSGSTGLATSSDTLTQVVDRATTTTALTSSVNPSTAGQSVTLTATVTSSGSPVSTGTVQFSVDGTVVQPATAPDAGGHVTLTTGTLATGSHVVRAVFNGDDAHSASEATLEQSVLLAADAGGPYTVAEGARLSLDGSGSTPGATIGWDLNGDGDYTDASGVAPTLSWADLEALGIDDGPADHEVRAQATLAGAAPATSTSVGLAVTNTAPQAVVTGSRTATVGKVFTLKVGANDPSSGDMAGTFTYTVDWGDGSPMETLTGPADPPVTHTYRTAGPLTASFTAADRDGGASGSTTVQVVVAPAEDSS